MRDFVKELRPNRCDSGQPVLGLVAAHRQKRDHELAGVLVGHPGQLPIDDRFDRSSGAIEAAPDPVRLGEAELSLLLFHRQKIVPRSGEALVERGQRDAPGLVHRALDRVEALRCLSDAGIEVRDRVLARIRDEIPDPDPHGREPGLEPLARVGKSGRILDAEEGAFNVGLTGGERTAIGQEADDRDHRDCDDTAANRNPRVERLECKNARHPRRHGTGCAGGY